MTVLILETFINDATFDYNTELPSSIDGETLDVKIVLQDPTNPESCTIKLLGYHFLPQDLLRLVELSEQVKKSAENFE